MIEVTVAHLGLDRTTNTPVVILREKDGSRVLPIWIGPAEASAIAMELRLSGYGDRFDFETRWAAEPHDLLRELRVLKPTVLHFSGHGGPDGLFFRAPNGDARLVSPAALAATFAVAGRSVKLVVLSACNSEAPAEALLAHVDYVVGMSGALHAGMARAFAIGFYGALATRRLPRTTSVEEPAHVINLTSPHTTTKMRAVKPRVLGNSVVGNVSQSRLPCAISWCVQQRIREGLFDVPA